MIKMILKRIVQLIPILLIVVTITFFITRIIPGDPAAIVLGPQAPAEAVEALHEELGLNKPIMVQYVEYLKQILHGDLGKSYHYNKPVTELIMERFPNTVELSAASLIIALLVGIPAGVLAAKKQNSLWDYLLSVLSLCGVSIPIFWLGLMVVLLFSVNLGWFPTLGIGSMENGIGDVISHMVLPTLCLMTIPAASFARTTRSAMLEVIGSDYIKALRARGILERKVIFRHALKNAFSSIVTVVGIQAASLLSGAIMTETIFSWPGIGKLIVEAVGNRDYALIQSCVLFVAIVYVFINLVVDIIYILINPKVSFAGEGGKA
ncbi:MAG: ABC transporter permease [Lachnospiraceae bacterium]